jgi:hypothetical protein
MPVLHSLAFQNVDDLLLVVHRSSGELDDADWQALCDGTRKLHGRTDKCLVLPGNVRLTPAQSFEIADVVRKGRMRVAVLCEGTATRAAVAALGWVTRRYRGFEPTSLVNALSYLGIAPERRGSILRVLNELARGVARPEVRATFTSPSPRV